jgi:hypothetical protein
VLKGFGRLIGKRKGQPRGGDGRTRAPPGRLPGGGVEPDQLASAALIASKFGRSFGVGVCSAYYTTPSRPMTKAARAAVSPTPASIGKSTP